MARRPRPDAPAPVLAAGGGAGLRELPGVGPAMAEKLAARGLLSVQDLWLHLPLRYEDRTRLTAIRDLVPGEPAQVEGRVEAVERGFRYRPLLRVTVVDDSRASLGLRFFHFNAAQAAQFVVGRRVRCYGEPRPAGHGLEIVHPSYRFLNDAEAGVLHDRLDPVYPGVEGVGPQVLSRLIGEALKRLPPAADLDVSVIDEMPPGRTPVTTVALSEARREEVVERIRHACAQGRQVYWVCTLIDEAEPGEAMRIDAQAAQATYEALGVALPQLRVGLLHGRMKPAQKQQVMAAFKAGELQLLVATTVIEVGVDVPNASLMVIENAERLGLAQVHQLRGRVGRGAEASSCALLYKPPLSQLARQRLDVMRQTTDGFVIAEKDLELRGPGELLGTRQTGIAAFRVADLVRDAALLPAVHRTGDKLLEGYPAQAQAIVERWVGGAARFAGA